MFPSVISSWLSEITGFLLTFAFLSSLFFLLFSFLPSPVAHLDPHPKDEYNERLDFPCLECISYRNPLYPVFLLFSKPCSSQHFTQRTLRSCTEPQWCPFPVTFQFALFFPWLLVVIPSLQPHLPPTKKPSALTLIFQKENFKAVWRTSCFVFARRVCVGCGFSWFNHC